MALIARYCGFENDVHFRVQDRVAAIDGDTLRSGDTTVRLYGIDAPELDQTCTDANGKAWGLRPLGANPAQSADRGEGGGLHAAHKFNRVVAACRTSSVPDLGEALVREGLAVNFGPGGDEGLYPDAEAEAEAAKRGLWQGSFEPPSKWREAHPREQNEQR